MASVYTFSYSDGELLAELMKVLGAGGGSFREQWTLQAEAVVEPVGWDALWKLSKEFCQKLGVRFPCVAYVSVTGVDWEALAASLEVRGVQHERVRLPATRDDVPLIELWPTRHQSEPCIDAHSTAEFIHFLRFYYNNIWMPWDDLDDKVMLPNTLEERMKLWIGAHDGTIPMRVARRITLLRNEAISTYAKIREADSAVDPDDLTDNNDSMLPDNFMSRCAEMHARLDYLLSKWTTFENPLIRASYLADQKMNTPAARSTVSILWKGGNMQRLQQLCGEVARLVRAEQRVAVCACAEEALASEPAQLFVCSERYEIPDIPLAEIVLRGIVKGCTLVSPEVRSCLLVVIEDTELHDLTLHCSQVNTAVVVRHGTLLAKGCRFTDDSDNCQRDFAQGAVVMTGARAVFDGCTFDNFYTALVVHSGAQVELRNCTVRGCGVGVQMFDGGRVQLAQRSRVAGCAEQCVRYEMQRDDTAGDEEMPCVPSLSSLKGLEISPCSTVGDGSESDVCVVRQEISSLF